MGPRRGILFLVLLTWISAWTPGCNRSARHDSQKRSQDKKIEHAYSLIDQGLYTEAIQLFWHILDEENRTQQESSKDNSAKENSIVRLGLASAYSARAGILVTNYWEFLLPSFKLLPPSRFEATESFRKTLYDHRHAFPPELKKDSEQKLEQLSQLHYEIETLRWRAQNLPLLRGEKEKRDILSARGALKGLTAKGVGAYRSLLTLILIRYEVSVSEKLLHPLIETKLQPPCSRELMEWALHLQTPLQWLGELFDDLKVAFPKRQKDLLPVEADFQRFQNRLNDFFQHDEVRRCREKVGFP